MTSEREQLFTRFSVTVNPPLDQRGIRVSYEQGYEDGFEKGRESMGHRDAERIGLPPAPFFYTMEQVATMLQIQEPALRKITFYTGRSTGSPPRGKLVATNLAPDGETPVWRVLDTHFIQYLRFKNIRFHTPGYR